MANWPGLAKVSTNRMGCVAVRAILAGRTDTIKQSAGRPKWIKTDNLDRRFGLAPWTGPKTPTAIFLSGVPIIFYNSLGGYEEHD
jgi:hypothetical protein